MTASHTDQAAADTPAPGVNLTIDGVPMNVPKGTLLIRAAEQLGVAIPRFCDHPLLDPVGACRQCIVDVEGQRKPLTACTTVVTEGMVVKTQLTSEMAAKAQAGTMELLLINHPLDCPVCDKGGECPLQNQAMSAGRPASRFVETKRTYPKPLPISSEVLLDRERCVLCARCTRFSEQIAGDPFIDLFERGANQQVSVYRGEAPENLDPTAVSGGPTGLDGVAGAEVAEAPAEISDPFNSYFSGNTIQICPVGALTSAAYRFRARPFDLVSTPTVCEHCSSGCAQRTDWRRNRVLRRLAGEDPEVNEEWNCDKGRFAFAYPAVEGRITTPLIRNNAGRLVEASWSEALTIAAEGLREAREAAGVGVLTGGRLTVEDAFAYSLFARAVLGTNDIDFRARPHSAEEADFLAGYVVGSSPESGGVTYRALDVAPTVLLAGFEPEEESPIVFLRLRKAARGGKTKVCSIAPWATEGLRKLSGTLIPTVPGTEHLALDALASGTFSARGDAMDLSGAKKVHDVAAGAEKDAAERVAAGLREPGAVILVGERLAETPGALVAALRLAAATGARLAWVPRRAGDRGAIAAGALPNLLPGGRPVTDPTARESLEGLLELPVGTIPTWPGRDTTGIFAAAAEGELDALVIAGVDIDDLADPAVAAEALDRVGFCLSLELRHSSVTAHADVVLPVAAVVEKAGTFLDWEGRERPFEQALRNTTALRDAQVLDALAAELDVTLGASDLETLRSRWRQTASAGNAHAADPAASVVPVVRPTPRPGEAVLSSWHHLLDSGALQVGEENLAGTAPAAVVRLSAATAAGIGSTDGDSVTVSTEHGAITLPLVVTPMPDHVVWLPTNSPGSALRSTLRVTSGALVRLSAGVAEVSNRADFGEIGAEDGGRTPTSGKSAQGGARRQSEEGGAA